MCKGDTIFRVRVPAMSARPFLIGQEYIIFSENSIPEMTSNEREKEIADVSRSIKKSS